MSGTVSSSALNRRYPTDADPAIKADGLVSVPIDNVKLSASRSGENSNRSLVSMALTTKLDGWKRIGNYALNFSWGDSHAEGIYAYDFLRGLCPCGVCRLPERYTTV